MKIIFNEQRVRELIVSLNTWDQLYEKGQNREGKLLSSIGGNYTITTMRISQDKGQPKRSIYHIDLFDTGEFYKSFHVELRGKDIAIIANTIKDDTDLIDDWGREIIGLTEENKANVSAVAKPFLIAGIKKHIQKRAA